MLSKNLSLADYRKVIKKEIRWVDRKPYSHNIICMTLLAVSVKFGYDEANKIIDDFDLESLGWQHCYKKEKNNVQTN